MTVWLTSDPHYGHQNILRYCNRPFADVAEMNEALIANWNAKVRADDVVYVLGDVFFCQLPQARATMHRLKGHKKLICGNHDRLIKKSQDLQALFDEVLPDLHAESIDGIYVVMSHYPLLSWNKMGRGAFMLHGHVHSRTPCDGKVRRYDVGVDGNNYSPVSFAEIKRALDKVEGADNRDRAR